MPVAFTFAELGLHQPNASQVYWRKGQQHLPRWRLRRRTLRRRPCYANSRLLQLPQLRWVWPRWPRLPRRPSPVTAGTVADGMAVGMAARASSSAARAIMATATLMAAAMCGGWSRRHGDPARGW